MGPSLPSSITPTAPGTKTDCEKPRPQNTPDSRLLDATPALGAPGHHAEVGQHGRSRGTGFSPNQPQNLEMPCVVQTTGLFSSSRSLTPSRRYHTLGNVDLNAEGEGLCRGCSEYCSRESWLHGPQPEAERGSQQAPDHDVGPMLSLQATFPDRFLQCSPSFYNELLRSRRQSSCCVLFFNLLWHKPHA